jgi:hypothetical protein
MRSVLLGLVGLLLAAPASAQIGVGGDASAANQATQITHLSEIETAVEAVEAATAASTAYSVVWATAMLAVNIKNAAGVVDAIQCTGTPSATVYVRLVNKSTTPDPSADASSLILVRGFVHATTGGFHFAFPGGLTFDTGIGIAATEAGDADDADETALTALEGSCNVQYR